MTRYIILSKDSNYILTSKEEGGEMLFETREAAELVMELKYLSKDIWTVIEVALEFKV